MSVTRQVPCGTCTACCRGELIVLHPEDGDRASRYLTRRMRNPLTGKLVDVIEQRLDGACIYLGEDGCTIHAGRPAICRSFDCRRLLEAAEAGLAPLGAVIGNPVLLAALALRRREASSGRPPEQPPLTDPRSPTAVTAGGASPQPETSHG